MCRSVWLALSFSDSSRLLPGERIQARRSAVLIALPDKHPPDHMLYQLQCLTSATGVQR